MNELKRELSRLSGVDFFNPKYRDVFKKYFPGDKDAEEEKVKAMGDAAEEEINDKTEDIDKAEDEREIDKIEEEKAENPEKKAEKAEEVEEESHEIGKEVDEFKEDKTDDELLKVKIENELLRGGVREDKLGSALKLARSEVGSLEELGKVREILREYPEWLHGYKAKGFGMSVDNDTDNLTEEEKRLKQMGINPRD